MKSNKEFNDSNIIVTGLDGHGSVNLCPLKDMFDEGDNFNMSLPEGTESVILYVGYMTDQCQEIVFYCIEKVIPIIVKYHDPDTDEVVCHRFLSRKEAKKISKTIQSQIG